MSPQMSNLMIDGNSKSRFFIEKKYFSKFSSKNRIGLNRFAVVLREVYQ